MKYQIESPICSGIIETKTEENTARSRGPLGERVEVVNGTVAPTSQFYGWWIENVKRYCRLRGWKISTL